jgi:bacterioferritin-associated ferredoxin
MLVCHCNGVSDRTVRRVVREGALTVAEVARACGAGTCCQGCSPTINRIIRIESHRQARVVEDGVQPVANSPS